MQPDPGPGVETKPSESGDPARGAVSSRRRALERLCDAVRHGKTGPVLITGEPGAGKTWLARRLVEGLPSGWRAVTVEVSSALDALEFLRLIGQALGSTMPDRHGAARGAIQAALQDAANDGRSWLLIVDQTHRSSPPVWEEIHALTDQLGRSGGFAFLILLSATELIRHLTNRPLDAWATRIRLHLHLMPLDLDEARALLTSCGRANTLVELALEELHRNALGNPGRLLAITESWKSAPRPSRGERFARDREPAAAESERLGSAPGPRPLPRTAASASASGIATPPEEAGPVRSPPLIPTRPPLRLEEGLVEVGWEGDLEAELVRGEDSGKDRDGPRPGVPDPNEELVEDRYAALQAWAEWTRNRERSLEAGSASAMPGAPAEPIQGQGTAPGDGPVTAAAPSSAAPAANLRSETPHEFAPYSQLFTRLRQSGHG